MGLVKLVVESQTKRNVQRLTQTYLTLSLEDIAAAVNLPSATAAELVILRSGQRASFAVMSSFTVNVSFQMEVTASAMTIMIASPCLSTRCRQVKKGSGHDEMHLRASGQYCRPAKPIKPITAVAAG